MLRIPFVGGINLLSQVTLKKAKERLAGARNLYYNYSSNTMEVWLHYHEFWAGPKILTLLA